MTAEFVNFVVFPRERFHGSHAGDAFLCDGVQLGSLLADLVVDLAQSLLHAHGAEADQRQDHQRNKGEIRAQPEHTDQHEDGMRQRFHGENADEADHNPDFIHVLFRACHQFTGVVLVKKVHRHGLDVPEQVAAHMVADRNADVIVCKFLDVLKNGAPDADAEQPEQKPHQQFCTPGDDHIVDDAAGDLRRHHVQRDADDHSGEAEQIQKAVALHISSQFFHDR